MSNWKDTYREKLATAEEAVKCIESGNRVVIGHTGGEPAHVVDAMLKRAPELKNVEIAQMLALRPVPYDQPEYADSFRLNCLFVSGATRNAVEQGPSDYTTCYFSEIPLLFSENTLPVDVALIHVAPPDEDGNCSYGVSVDYISTAAEHAKIVIAQVNSCMPRTNGTTIHVDKIDYIIEHDAPLPVLNPPKIGEVEKAIGQNIVKLVKDGDTLQLGIGAIPDATLLFLTDKKDLGIHTEMFSDGIVDLFNDGIVNNSKKTLRPGKMVSTFLMGTKKLYDFVHNNPGVEMLPVNYTNDPFVIAQNDNLISINSALQVDLLGQVNAETIGYTQFSGVGGQVDFFRGARRSKGGKAIIAMPSTASKGKLSRIVLRLDEGSVVTTNRNDVEYFVTEYGIAKVRGLTRRQRVEALISIAHPDFRESLTQQAREAGLLK